MSYVPTVHRHRKTPAEHNLLAATRSMLFGYLAASALSREYEGEEVALRLANRWPYALAFAKSKLPPDLQDVARPHEVILIGAALVDWAPGYILVAGSVAAAYLKDRLEVDPRVCLGLVDEASSLALRLGERLSGGAS